MTIKMVGYNIANAMRKNNVTISELSRRTKHHRSSLYERIEDPEKMQLGMLIRIAKAIGVDFRELLEGVE